MSVLWSDNFNDGNYNGWTVGSGNWSASSYSLVGTTDGGYITTDSNVIPSGGKIFLFRWKHPGTGDYSDQVRHRVIYQDDNNYLQFFSYQSTSTSNRVDLIECIAGSSNTLYTDNTYNYYNDAGTWFWVKIYKDGNTGKFKIWKDGESEPGWLWEGTFNSNLIDSGKFRVVSTYVDANGTFIDDIEVSSIIISEIISETLSLADTITVQFSYFKTISESLGLSDSIVKLTNFQKIISETLNLSDVVSTVREFFLTISETLNITDKISAIAKGIWITLKKHTTSWTKKPKHTTTWTKQSKHTTTWTKLKKHG